MSDPFFEPYDEKFYNEQTSDRQAFEEAQLAFAIHKVLRPISVVDVGCGRGVMLQAFGRCECVLQGFEAPLPIKFLIPEGLVTKVDLRNPIALRKIAQTTPDVMLNLEVCEHLPKKDAEALIKAMCDSSATHIVFSGACVGQGGTGHINEQPREYWGNQFIKNGRKFRGDIIERISMEWYASIGKVERCWWFPINLMVFK